MDENYALLLDIYGELLSKNQREAVDLKYNSDLSLSEIAEEMGGISRPAANDARKKGEKRLRELEDALGNARRLKLVSEKIKRARTVVSAIAESSGENNEQVSELLEIFSEIEEAM
ncbi:MAG: DNA-binding protein [Oscillospiraceae bacterium]|nr:DNA-binding protein [Oscillospiraceae bacterium]